MIPLPIIYELNVRGIYISETAPLRFPKFEPPVKNNAINLQLKFQKHSTQQSLLDNYLNSQCEKHSICTLSAQSNI